jgi:hypothetical protein
MSDQPELFDDLPTIDDLPSYGSITINNYVENEDGSAILQFTASKRAVQMLVGEGLKSILMGAADEES